TRTSMSTSRVVRFRMLSLMLSRRGTLRHATSGTCRCRPRTPGGADFCGWWFRDDRFAIPQPPSFCAHLLVEGFGEAESSRNQCAGAATRHLAHRVRAETPAPTAARAETCWLRDSVKPNRLETSAPDS